MSTDEEIEKIWRGGFEPYGVGRLPNSCNEGWERTRNLMRQQNQDTIARRVYQGQSRQLRSGVWMDASGQVSEGADACSAAGQAPRPLARTVEIDVGTWAEMRAQLIGWALRRYGSRRRAARALDVPRSTLGAWVAGL